MISYLGLIIIVLLVCSAFEGKQCCHKHDDRGANDWSDGELDH